MALIIYPTAGWDSFVSLVDAEAYIGSLTLDLPAWQALAADLQEKYLRIATRLIVDGIDQVTNPLPDPAPACLVEATALIASWDLKNGLSASAASTGVTGSVKKQKVASLEIEYYDVSSGKTTTQTISPVPDIAKPCLEGLGFVFAVDKGGLGMVYLGRM